MGGVAVTPKYLIHATIEVEGVVERSDVIGALFGQTEGLLGDKLDLRELQKSGRIGRVQVNIESKGGKSRGTIEIPSSLDKVETALIAAAIETVDKVGPCDARIRVTKIEDVREEKRKRIIERAKELLLKWRESEPESRELTEEVLKAVREAQLTFYGPDRLPAGPDVDKSDTVIIVEGRADVVNLLRHDYRNVIAMEGAVVPKTIVDLTKEKTAIAFVDGDRGGELVLKELLQVADIDYVARAPPGKEVEELTGKEIAKCLRDKVPADQVHLLLERPPKEAPPPAKRPEVPGHVVEAAKSLQGTLEALLYDAEWRLLQRVAVRDLADTLQSAEGVKYVVYDGVATQRLVDIAERKGVSMLVCARVGDLAKKPASLEILTIGDLVGPSQ